MVLPICQTAKEPSYASVDNIPTHRSPFWIFVAQSTLLFVIVALKPASRKLSFIIALVFKPAGPLKVQSPPLTIRWILSELPSEESYHRILLQIFLKSQSSVSSVSLKFSRFSIFRFEFVIKYLTFSNESLFLHVFRDFLLSLLSISSNFSSIVILLFQFITLYPTISNESTINLFSFALLRVFIRRSYQSVGNFLVFPSSSSNP